MAAIVAVRSREVMKNEGQNVPLPMLFKVVYVVQK